MIDEDFRTLLLGLLPGVPVEKGKVSQEQPGTRVQYQRQEANQDLDLDGTPGLNETVFDVEVGSTDPEASAALAFQLRLGQGVVLATLNGAIDNAQTTFTVNVAESLPANGLPFVIQIGAEQMLLTAFAGTTATVTRGYNGTTPAAHGNSTNVIATGLHGWRGPIGNSVILGTFVRDHSDDYSPKMLDSDEGYFVATFQATVVSQ
jgi:hypothetical protein